ncbi:phosphodiesterase [Novosphingobium sp. JCM 18896]|uniref:phosphodiesterase n=1 Tax=Novosphingobium sp. JCM 18896 TaxID=2989731 RepID=UPI002221FB9A|nr:phosphodiesterase [Novosphingobium sp. JCM 18896]MCW1429068.1 phosphodiesterase [Novosphingobium sp. JCM 18896]
MLIAQITDVHIGFDRDNPDELNMQRLRAVIARLVEGPNRPDLLLMTGDLTEAGDPDSYARLAAAVADCPFPVHAMVGNHDDRAELVAAFPDTPSEGGFVHYAIALAGLRLIVLDTLEPGRHGGAFCAARVAWLRDQLARDPATPTFIVMHHPPIESGITWLDSAAHEPWIARFAGAVAGFDQVRGIIAGHLHRTIHTQWNGLSLSVCPSTAPAVALDLSPIDEDRPDSRELITDELPGYALHRWDGRNLITHFESVGRHVALARFDRALQPMIKGMMAERREG